MAKTGKVVKNWLDELFEEFIKDKNVKEKTKRKCEGMYFLLSGYASERGVHINEMGENLNVEAAADRCYRVF